ncbi:MAG: hypothetical protein OEV41_03845, partial [Gammaproteobacteria bacterium]|nr:hypothetical protein [Gammaproteobacteria bacterium]
MTGSARFERYLDDFRLRLERLVIARGLAVLAVALLVVTVVAVALAIRRGFPAGLVTVSRLVLFGMIAAIVYRLIVLPVRGVRRNGARDIERRAPAFAGRISTWTEMDDDRHPLAELLAEDSLRIADAHPPASQVPGKEFARLWSVAGTAALALLFLAVAGPGNYGYGARHLWFGWALPGLLPPQRIDVLPGDDGIRLGGTVRVQAAMSGFDPPDASVHARFGDGEWQQVSMADDGERFEFTFFSVREPLEYYVSAANVRSETFEIQVVDLPVVENVAVTYRYPDWTGRDDETKDPGGDVRAIAETEITVTVTADRPMTPGDLVIGELAVPLDVDGESASATFTVEEDGQYFVAARVGGESIRLTDDYFVTLAEDLAPEI